MPAEEATIGKALIQSSHHINIIGVFDKIFARVGAHDNLVKHMSTFHVEMTETAHILSNATPRSFVLLDEIGSCCVM